MVMSGFSPAASAAGMDDDAGGEINDKSATGLTSGIKLVYGGG
jgi:hypothetical protein